MRATGAHAVMAATSLLSRPRAFGSSRPSGPTGSSGRSATAADAGGNLSCVEAVAVAEEYLVLAEQYPPPSALYISKHLRWIFRAALQPAYKAATKAAMVKRQQEKQRRERAAAGSSGPSGSSDADASAEPASAIGGTGDGPRPGVSPEELEEEEEDGWSDWRVQVWKFLARVDLTQRWQFCEVVRFIAVRSQAIRLCFAMYRFRYLLTHLL